MKKSLTAVALLSLFVAACGQQQTPPPAPKAEAVKEAAASAASAVATEAASAASAAASEVAAAASAAQ